MGLGAVLVNPPCGADLRALCRYPNEKTEAVRPDATHNKHHHTYWGQYTWAEKSTCTKTACKIYVYMMSRHIEVLDIYYYIYILEVCRQRATGGGVY